MLHLLARECRRIIAPKVRPSRHDELHLTVALDGTRHLIRLVTFVSGVPLAELPDPAPELLRAVGEALGSMDVALRGFDHPGVHRHLRWDLKATPHLRPYVQYVAEPARRARLTARLDRFESTIAPRLPALRAQVIHNDANDHNVLIADASGGVDTSIGLIDFGDVVHSYTVGELAIAATYAMLDRPDPVRAIGPLVRGYTRAHPLYPDELELLGDLILTRLTASTLVSAYEHHTNPANPYSRLDEERVWRLFDVLEAMRSEELRDSFSNVATSGTD